LTVCLGWANDLQLLSNATLSVAFIGAYENWLTAGCSWLIWKVNAVKAQCKPARKTGNTLSESLCRCVGRLKIKFRARLVRIWYYAFV